jgi:imidazolonepropionase-like amidohydrolase
MRTILCPEWFIDGTGNAPLAGQAIVLSGDTIEAVVPQKALSVREGDDKIDMPGVTLLPGLINTHVHLVLPGDGSPFELMNLESDITLALRAASNAATCLSAGITTVRDCGGRGMTVIELRNRASASALPGCRVVACGWPVTITGGHGRYFGGEADGVEGLRKMVRRLVSSGAEFIKVLASGGGTPGSLAHFPSFTLKEMRSIVETSHALGLPVSAHCTATDSLSIAIEAGVDTIEHALFMAEDERMLIREDIADKLAESQIPVASTMQVARDMNDMASEGPDGPEWRAHLDADREIKARLHKLGVPLIAGSDAGWRYTQFGSFWKELDELVEIGMSPMRAVHAATGAAAQALGIDEQLGTIQPGRVADLLAVEGELARDIGCLAHVKAVYQSGARVS